VLPAAALYLALPLLTGEDAAEEKRFRDMESELAVTNLENAPLALFASGRTLEDAREIPLPADGRIWLAAGRYFLRSGRGEEARWFPVQVAGYRAGPDEGGSIRVVVRPRSRERPPLRNDADPEFVEVPAGPFLLGDRQNPQEPHNVWLTGFYLAPYEVTNGEFREFLRDPAGYANASWWTPDGERQQGGGSRSTATLPPGDAAYERFGRDDQPVVWVTWFEARAFCRWLTGRIGGGRWLFSLPTEAEWEKAARGPDGFDFALGMRISDAEAKLYNWGKNPGATETVCGIGATAGRFSPNRYGLYHMTGNVTEWTLSVHRPYGRNAPYRDDERNHDATDGSRVCRGGSWYSASTATMLIAYRETFQPEHSSQDVGFRIAAKRLP
jgi:formylglycine-generating enzyme required for sulfatase activity